LARTVDPVVPKRGWPYGKVLDIIKYCRSLRDAAVPSHVIEHRCLNAPNEIRLGDAVAQISGSSQVLLPKIEVHVM